MKIIHFIDTKGVGGAETVVMECVRGLLAQHQDVEVWHLGSDWLAAACDEAGVPHRVMWWPQAYKKAFLLPLFLLLLVVQLYRYKVKVIHSHIYSAVVSIGVISPLAPVSHVGTLHDTWFLRSRGRWRRFLLRSVMAAGTKVAVISNAMRAHVAQEIGRSPDELHVVYNGTDTARYFPATEARTDQTVRVLCVARLIARKRIDLLIEATGRLVAAGHKLETRIVGGGELTAELQSMIDLGGLAACVELMGEQEEIPGLLRDSDIFVLPSDDEGLPCSIIEAMACGLPIIASDVGGVNELVKPGENGFLFAAGEIDELVAVLTELLNNNQRGGFGLSSRRMVEQEFATNVMVRHYLDLYVLKKAA